MRGEEERREHERRGGEEPSRGEGRRENMRAGEEGRGGGEERQKQEKVRGRREALTKARRAERRGDKWRGENRTRQTKGRMHAEVWQSTPFIILSI